MDNQFFNTNGHNARPKDEIRIEKLEITPYADRYRVHVQIEVTPFQERPNLILVAHDEDDNPVGELDIIATMHAGMEFTMHLRDVDDPAGLYTLTADLFYETRNPPQDQRIVTFTIPEADES